LLELDEQHFLIADRNRLQSVGRRVLIDELTESELFGAISGGGTMLGRPVGCGLESGPAGHVGRYVDLIPLWVASAIMELVNPFKELVHKLGHLIITHGVLGPA
jgi:hypothetical protein